MADIKQITVGSTTYDINDTHAVKFSASQSLTDAQKTQARANIGAGTSSVNYYPSAVSWTNGTSSGPTGTITVAGGGSNVSIPAIPAASASQSGIVTTGDQSFKGNKSFTEDVSVSGTLKVFDDNTSSDPYRPIYAGNSSDPDCDTYIYGTGITLYDANDGTNYRYSFPSSDGILSLTTDQNLLCVGPSFAMDSSFKCIDQTVVVPSGKAINWYGKVAQIYLPPGTYTMVLKSSQNNMAQNLGRIQVNDNPNMQDLGTLYVQPNLSGRRGWFSEPSTFTLTNYTTLYLRYCMDCKGNGTPLSSGAVSVGHSFNIAIYRGPYAAEYRPYDYSLGNFFDIFYPVGSIYISTVDASPARLHGGTWERIKDRFLYASGTNAAGASGGEATHTLTTSEIPSHTHTLHPYVENGTSSVSNYKTWSTGSFVQQWWKEPVAISDDGFGRAEGGGEGRAHNNMPPYLVVYMWKRIS